MRAVLDACVLVPPVVRRCLLEAAVRGLYEPLWSDRILAEWQHAAARLGTDGGRAAAAAQAAMEAAFPRAAVPPAPGIEARLHLPDPGDLHVLATAVTGGADAIVTWNAADFPRGALAAEGIARRDPDGLLWEFHSASPGPMAAALAAVQAAAARDGETPALVPLLRRARLNRLARAVAAAA